MSEPTIEDYETLAADALRTAEGTIDALAATNAHLEAAYAAKHRLEVIEMVARCGWHPYDEAGGQQLAAMLIRAVDNGIINRRLTAEMVWQAADLLELTPDFVPYQGDPL